MWNMLELGWDVYFGTEKFMKTMCARPADASKLQHQAGQ